MMRVTTSIECTRESCGLTADDCKARCLHCGSEAIRFEDDGDVLCLDCGAREDDCGLYPELDALEQITEYYAEAPMGEPPAVAPWTAPRKPVQPPVRRKGAVA